MPKLRAVAWLAASRAAERGGVLDIDPVALLGERAAIARLERNGTISCGGGTRLLPAQGQRWLAVSLARPEDEELVPAWLEVDVPDVDCWATVAAAVAERATGALVERAALIGLPVGLLPRSSERPAPPPGDHLPFRRLALSVPRVSPAPLAGTVVVDLSALWAGPLCGSLLAAAGADVVKVEALDRPDGARRGPAAFFDLLNAGKRAVALDLRTADGRTALRHLVRHADVVLEASRPRALEHLGLHAEGVLASARTRVWASITGHGRTGPAGQRVAFGDDAAVAGGLVSGSDADPVFCADAVADPITGLVAAAGILDALSDGRSWLLDISMAGVAAHLAGPTLPVTPGTGAVAPPRARVPAERGPRLGEHTNAVLSRWIR